VRGDLLLTWLAGPGTALYLGYADRYEDEPAAPWASTARQFFVKFSYLLRP
jgi:hypothetical protein